MFDWLCRVGDLNAISGLSDLSLHIHSVSHIFRTHFCTCNSEAGYETDFKQSEECREQSTWSSVWLSAPQFTLSGCVHL